MHDKDGKLIKSGGLVLPAEWDHKGNVVAVYLSAFDEEEYLIDKNGYGRKLLSCLRKKVEVSGLEKEEGGRKCMKILTYRVME
ncbi:MAG: hypothetical protein ABII06_20345 [Pseudomonadota bacterium]